MLKKLSASLGIGSASVDTLLNQTSFYQGETLSGFIQIKGGHVEQAIEAIELCLCTEMKVEIESKVQYEPIVLSRMKINTPFIIQAKEQKEIEFAFPMHNETPITVLQTRKNKCHVWLETRLEIDFAIDPSDRDFLTIHPLPLVKTIISQLENAGYKMFKADVEKGFLTMKNQRSVSGCYQEIEFKNKAIFNRKEVELSFMLDNDVIHCLAEVDRLLGKSDRYYAFSLAKEATVDQINQALQPILN